MRARPNYQPQEIDYYFETKCGRKMGWSALSLDSLFRATHEKGYVITFVETMEEHNERELKESA